MSSVRSQAELKEFQRQMAGLLFQPLNTAWKTRKKTPGGDDIAAMAASLIKPNDRLSSFERLQIYNRCYWFRVLDSLYDDFPGLLALLGNRKFLKLVTAYLIRHPSESFTLRNLGSRLENFLLAEPEYAGERQQAALDMVRFEWAQIVAFDGPARKPVSAREIQGQHPESLRFGLQPYLTLLALDHAVDHYLLAVKSDETAGLRSAASNTSEKTPIQKSTRRPAAPKKERVYLAVHRYENALFYKRLEPEAFVLLTALKTGLTLESACNKALKLAKPTRKNSAAFQLKLAEWFADWSSLGWLTPYTSDKPKKTKTIL